MIFFDDWAGILRIAITAPIVYVAVILFIRLFGKRSTSKMNNFDWIVTIAIGSIVGSMIVLKNVVIVEGLEAIILLLALQYVVTKLSLVVPGVSQFVRATPSVLFFRGEFQQKIMQAERVTREEIVAAIRESGHSKLDQVEAVILESDANLSVIPRQGESFPETLKGLAGVESLR
ncbi:MULTISPECIES: DUF421 domain-containing protein [unclassified Coleofasciculus]|uniref:DUF421 domain-containing protein n=1 Tax=unclassified Coleofasciculus TaxID=2692782 RepID=UPI001880A62F|nr:MULTISPECIES: YetF domain-containing protein [unclassified Coleofasciculus]MBE9127701.1 DUF421 domain-containing protein [Coleofasciculus sp. LEGE 07081]MBE9151039.1 DUF421 domain-containing protein [Coleofasciculus sp. LEGE 07092]